MRDTPANLSLTIPVSSAPEKVAGMVGCLDCGGKVSMTAKGCSHCGSTHYCHATAEDIKDRRKTVLYIVVIVLSLGFTWGLVYFLNRNAQKAKEEYER